MRYARPSPHCRFPSPVVRWAAVCGACLLVAAASAALSPRQVRDQLKWFQLGTAVHTESHLPGLYACAATDGCKKAILLVNTGVARTVTVAGIGNVWMGAHVVELIER